MCFGKRFERCHFAEVLQNLKTLTVKTLLPAVFKVYVEMFSRLSYAHMKQLLDSVLIRFPLGTTSTALTEILGLSLRTVSHCALKAISKALIAKLTSNRCRAAKTELSFFLLWMEASEMYNWNTEGDLIQAQMQCWISEWINYCHIHCKIVNICLLSCM